MARKTGWIVAGTGVLTMLMAVYGAPAAFAEERKLDLREGARER